MQPFFFRLARQFRNLASLVFILLVFSGASFAAWNEQMLEEKILWEEVSHHSGIRISTGEWPGSDFVAFRTETEYEASEKALLNLIEDVAAYRDWMPDCKESRLLKQTGQSSYVYYVAMNSPWPLNNRDWVNRLQVIKNDDDGSIMVLYQSADGFLEEQPDTVRVRKHFALWILKPVGRNRYHSIWYAHSEPGGWIPAWAVRLTYDRYIQETTENMKRVVLSNQNQ